MKKADLFKRGFSTGQNSMHMNLPPATRTLFASLSTCKTKLMLVMVSAHTTPLYGIYEIYMYVYKYNVCVCECKIACICVCVCVVVCL